MNNAQLDIFHQQLLLDIFHQQLLLMRTTQEVIDLANGCLTLPSGDPRAPILNDLDRMYCALEDEESEKSRCSKPNAPIPRYLTPKTAH